MKTWQVQITRLHVAVLAALLVLNILVTLACSNDRSTSTTHAAAPTQYKTLDAAMVGSGTLQAGEMQTLLNSNLKGGWEFVGLYGSIDSFQKVAAAGSTKASTRMANSLTFRR